jgi:hypothetical protein
LEGQVLDEVDVAIAARGLARGSGPCRHEQGTVYQSPLAARTVPLRTRTCTSYDIVIGSVLGLTVFEFLTRYLRDNSSYEGGFVEGCGHITSHRDEQRHATDRFAAALTDNDRRLGTTADRCSFDVGPFSHLPLCSEAGSSGRLPPQNLEHSPAASRPTCVKVESCAKGRWYGQIR